MTTTEIKEYLENYTAKKAIAEYKKKQGLTEDRTLVCITAIEDCIAGLPNGLDEIIRKYYLQKMSLREMSKRFFLGRDAIARRRDKAIAIISDCLAGTHGTRHSAGTARIEAIKNRQNATNGRYNKSVGRR